MKNRNIEIKARIDDFSTIRAVLAEERAIFKGIDHQCDTYFNVPHGRLKIREGNIENCIVWYERPDIAGPKSCAYQLIPYERNDPALSSLRELLEMSLGSTVQVVKEREIYYIENIKIHLDTIKGLGSFLEIEVIGAQSLDENYMRSQCDRLLLRCDIAPEALIENSYADMLSEMTKSVKTTQY